jgi:activator of HSP90 ATPase
MATDANRPAQTSPTKKTASKKTAAKKTTAKKTTTKKTAAKKTTAKKTTAKKTAAKKTTAKKTAAKKTAAKKTTAKKTAAKKTTAKKTAAKKTAAKKTAAKKTAAKKTAAKKRNAGGTSNARATAGVDSTRTIVQHVFLPAPAATIFHLLTDPIARSAFTGTVCEGEPIETGRFTASSGYVLGQYEALETDRRIVCTWRTTEWPKGAEASRLEFILEPVDGGTELTMTHSELPASQADDIRQGWIDDCWTPMREHLAAQSS